MQNQRYWRTARGVIISCKTPKTRMKIPFDALCLECSLTELAPFLGGRMQRFWAVDANTVCIEIYAQQKGYLTISWDVEFGRLTVSSTPPKMALPATPFLTDLRKHLDGQRIVSAQQIGFDRLAELKLSNGSLMRVEILGKHSNLIVLDPAGVVLAAAKFLGAKASRRVVLPGQKLGPSQFRGEKPSPENLPPFLRAWVSANGFEAAFVRPFRPVSGPGGAYPLPLPDFQPINAYGPAAEEHFQNASIRRDLDRQKNSLLGQLRRVELAREVALSELHQAADTASRAREFQVKGELILAYQGQIKPGNQVLEAWDMEGHPVQIPVNPDLTPLENAEKLFKKAKRAKSGESTVRQQIERLQEDLHSLTAILDWVENAEDQATLDKAMVHIQQRGWLHRASPPGNAKEDRPYEGKAIRELLGPHGYKLLYGDNREANDYLTLRVAKPNDWWLHVRGGPSTHVVIQTQNQPTKVPHDVLLFAAKIAAKQSPSKHSSWVAVDYTLKKYVRRPKGAEPGMASYTHEKTLHVNPQEA